MSSLILYLQWVQYLSKYTLGMSFLCKLLLVWCFCGICKWLVPSCSFFLSTKSLSYLHLTEQEWKLCFHRLILLVFTGVWRGDGAAAEWFQRSLLSVGQRGHMERGACPYHTGLAHKRNKREREREKGRWLGVWVSVSFFSRAGFYKPLGRKWGGGHPLTCSHLPPLSLSQKQFKQLMELGWSSFQLIQGHCDSYCSFLIRAPQA